MNYKYISGWKENQVTAQNLIDWGIVIDGTKPSYLVEVVGGIVIFCLFMAMIFLVTLL